MAIYLFLLYVFLGCNFGDLRKELFDIWSLECEGF